MDRAPDPQTAKQEIRRQARDVCRALPDKDERSRTIWSKFIALDAYRLARTVMCYVHVRDEVRTREFLPAVLLQGKTLVVPYCDGDELGLFRLESLDELRPGTLGIPEPPEELRRRPDKMIDAAQLDLIMVPGAAFDRQGGRVGHGKGYYDRLLGRTRPDASKVGVAFGCQILPSVPMLAYDRFMDKVITEDALYSNFRQS